MPWPCKLIDPDERKGEPGEMWFVKPGNYTDEMVMGRIFSDEYKRDWKGKRPPIAVRLPDGSAWCIDQAATGITSGWSITGEAPFLTASPSINADPGGSDRKGYHGWLKNGVLSDDCEGRHYE